MKTALLLLLTLTCLHVCNAGAETCDREIAVDAAAVPLDWPKVHKKTVSEQSCGIAMSQAAQWEEEGDLFWIDRRPVTAMRTMPLNGVIEIPPPQPVNKTFLFDGTIILIGTGFDQSALNGICRALRQDGHNAFVLRGGIRSWAKAGRFIGGAFSLDEISPEEYLAGSATIPWQVIAVGLDEDGIQRLPESPVKRLAFSEKTIPQLIRDMRVDKRNREQTEETIETVFIARDAQQTASMKQLWHQHGGPGNAVWLRGGWQAYQHYIETQHGVLVGKGRSVAPPCGGTS